jgi:hypothetical protein
MSGLMLNLYLNPGLNRDGGQIALNLGPVDIVIMPIGLKIVFVYH